MRTRRGKARLGFAKSDVPRPPVRHMTVIAQDPAVRHNGRIVTAKIALPAEDLAAGPIGYRLQLVDYDSTSRRFNGKHSLPRSYEDEPISWQNGRPSMVDDFRFHAQNTYALIMKTLARFEFALGRRLGWSFRTHQIKVAPHGMYDANAFYSPDQEGLVFGYFNGLSGNTVYTCLSHDIVVHETTHALVDALRERYMQPSNPDQAAFHEGFADVIALLSVFALPEVITHLLQPNRKPKSTPALISRKDVTKEALYASALFGLAEEMGNEIESIRGGALRKSAKIEPDPSLQASREFLEPHRRGELFVAAVMRGFIDAWAMRISGMASPSQKKFPLARVAEEGADIADTLATMWVRALDYMPPVHLEFGDALSAALTADLEVRPDDSRYELRKRMLEQFDAYGFTPSSKRKDPIGVWDTPPERLRYDRVRFESMQRDKDEVFRFIWDNREELELRDGAYTEVLSVRPCVRTGMDGFIVRETVAEYYQVARLTPKEMRAVGVIAPAGYIDAIRELSKARRALAKTSGSEPVEDVHRLTAAEETDDDALRIPLYGGGVLIFDEYGRVKYWVHNDVFGRRQGGRLDYLWKEGYLRPGRSGEGARLRSARLSTLHRLRATDAHRLPAEGW